MQNEIIKKYKDYLTLEKRRSPHTVESYVREAVALLRLGSLPQLGLEQIRGRIRDQSKLLTASSQALMVSALKSFLQWAAENQYVSEGLDKELSRPRVPKKLIRVVDEEDLSLLLKIVAKAPLEEKVLFEFLYGSGLRIAEAKNLKWSQVQWDDQALIVYGKRKKERKVPLTPSGLSLLRQLQAEGARGSFVLPEALSIRELRRRVERWGIDSGLGESIGRLYPHKLRHSIATHLLRRGAPLPQLQKLLGHSQLSTTERYTHLKIEDLLKAYDQSFPLKKSQK